MRKIVLMMVFMAAVVVLQIGFINDAAAKGKVACSPDGAWAYPNGTDIAMIMPLDSTGKRFVATSNLFRPTPENPNQVLTFRGILEKIGPNLYGYTLYKSHVDSEKGVVKEILVGETWMLDCDTRHTLSAYRKIYEDGSQSPWMTGLDGEVERIKLVPAPE